MNLNNLIIDTLEPLGVPVVFANYNSVKDDDGQPVDTYIVFVEYNQAPWLNADDKELYTKHFFQVDVFSSGNYLQLVSGVKQRMKAAGFGRMFESETYDDGMKKFRKIMRFSYISKNKEE